MERLSSAYGWTPKQIKNQSIDEINNYLAILNVKSKLRERELNK